MLYRAGCDITILVFAPILNHYPGIWRLDFQQLLGKCHFEKLTDRMAAELHATQPQSKSHFPAVGRKSDMATRRLHESSYLGILERVVLNWETETNV